MVNLGIKDFSLKKKKSDNHILTMTCVFTVNFANLSDEDI